MLQIFAKMTRAEGGEIHTGQKVTSIARTPTGWQVTTATEVYEAKTLINAAGAWADEIAKLAGITPVGITPNAGLWRVSLRPEDMTFRAGQC